MELLERFEEATETLRERRDSLDLSRNASAMELRTHCAYNQTRECFLGLEVTAADLELAKGGERFLARPLKSGEGLWVKPFHAIPSGGLPAPLDLIYLDRDCRVVETVESFPTFQVSASSPRAESVLALPAHSIYSSQTQPGDQLVLCVAEEMGSHLQRLSDARNGARGGSATIAGAVLLRERPLWSGGPGVLEVEDRNRHGSADAPPTYEMDLARPEQKTFKTPRNWFERWWSPDPRKAPRLPATGLAAYFWNGSAPTPHGVRDISSTGVYVVTEERWYPGTLVVMILQRSDLGEQVDERSIRVRSRAVRWGPDGVGLQFLLDDDADRRLDQAPMDAASRKELEQFLESLKLEQLNLDNSTAG